MENKKENSILKCFVSVTVGNYNDTQEQIDLATEQGREFRSYIWGEKGISNKIEQLNFEDYGNDLKLILFQFYVNPDVIEMQSLPNIEKYRKREKSIGIPVIINRLNFFNKSENERNEFLEKCFIQKLDVLEKVIIKEKLDTDIEKLKTNMIAILK
ncbi:hypothetical protein GN157_06420 [Flavobacterium rakeshii]|uniref:Uncharacterized protein n=1 Tax=Flavobacterium rakeshii TaxID=1038845 RepID=A0A6N8HA75_9FLAO|nr:hypothetical protein [Flavobacterium rakeshii]MUV03341.1 hypothetical protein [Flavobacterium rakeshii]